MAVFRIEPIADLDGVVFDVVAGPDVGGVGGGSIDIESGQEGRRHPDGFRGRPLGAAP